jgi:hypothetical protein
MSNKQIQRPNREVGRPTNVIEGEFTIVKPEHKVDGGTKAIILLLMFAIGSAPVMWFIFFAQAMHK